MYPSKSAVAAATLLLSLALSGCAADGGPRAREAARLALFEAHAGEPVENFRFWRMDRWEGLGRDAVAIWTRPDEAWLLRVQEPCTGLEYATVIGLSSNLNRVHRAFDAVLFEKQRCRIEQIRPVDARALKAAQRAAAGD
jgi:hypothetical protein